MDAENKSKSFGAGGSRGRIIFLGDGTEVLTGSDDTEMFDNADEDKDLENQVPKGTASADSASTAKTDEPAAAAASTQDKSTAEEVKKEN
jgi:protein phosphatase 2C family protein 2/3